MFQPKKEFMETAIEEVLKSKEKGDYAIGAVIVKDGKIVSRAGNLIRVNEDSIQHAEILVIQEASALMKSRFLEGCILYSTAEPCPMCAAAAVWARMSGIVFGSTIQDMADYRQKNGNEKFTWRTIDIPAKEILEKGDPKLFLVEGFMREECKKLFHG